MTIRRKRIQLIVKELLDSNRIHNPPVPVENIAKSRGISVRIQAIPESDISGFLVRRGENLVIGINANDPKTRQRFSIAHELGHFFLHRSSFEEFHIDRGFEVRYRDNTSSQGTDSEEREANSFAAELLMPMEFIARDVAQMGKIDLEDSVPLAKLAKRYNVSTQALQIRLANLGYVML